MRAGRGAKRARARRPVRVELLARLVVANLERAPDGERVELHVERAVFVDERDADAIPVRLLVAFGDHITDLVFCSFHVVLSVGTAWEARCAPPGGWPSVLERAS